MGPGRTGPGPDRIRKDRAASRKEKAGPSPGRRRAGPGPDEPGRARRTGEKGTDSRMVFEPPQRLVRALGETAPAGDDWLARLPGTAERAAARRELTVE